MEIDVVGVLVKGSFSRRKFLNFWVFFRGLNFGVVGVFVMLLL